MADKKKLLTQKRIDSKINLMLVSGIALIILSINFISAYAFSNPQYTQQGFEYSSGVLGKQTFDSRTCQAGQDFALQVAPFGCTPAVVRSDLLEEQDVWVFCPIAATKINPLIKIEAIDYLTFKNEEFSKYVSDVGFHPMRSALGMQDNLNSPILENIGYAVVKLKKIPTEAEMPDFVEGNVTARLVYDIENAFGTFRTGFYLKPMDDKKWDKEFLRYGFWKGKGYIRAENVQQDSAVISVYSGNTISRRTGSYQQKIATFSLKEGEKSQQVYLPTFDYCLGGLEVKLEDIKNPDTTALLKINADDVEVSEGENFLNEKCIINSIEKRGVYQKVIVSCEEDISEAGVSWFGRTKTFKLEINPKIELQINDEKQNYSIGDWLFDTKDGEKSVFLSYAYTKEDKPFEEDLRVVFTALPKEPVGSRKKLTNDELNSFKGFIERYRKDEPDSSVGNFWRVSWNAAEGIGFITEITSRWAISGESFDVLKYNEEGIVPEEVGVSEENTKKVKVLGLASPSDSEFMEENSDYKNAMKDFDILISDFPSIKEQELKEIPAYEQKSLEEKIKLARDTGQKKTMLELCRQFEEKFPNAPMSEFCLNELEFANIDISSEDILIDNKIREISLKGIYEPSFSEYGARIVVKFPDGKIRELALQKEDIVYLSVQKGENSKLIADIAERELNKWQNLKECDAKAKDYLKSYFESANYANWECSKTPWSAVFVSYVMKQAGADFPFNANHGEYFSKIKSNPEKYNFEAKKISEIDNIKTGDILCQCREESCTKSYSIDSPPEKGHCDIVVGVNGEEVTTIGGNLGDSVKKNTLKSSDIKNNKNYYGFLSYKSSVSGADQFIQLKELEKGYGGRKDYATIRVNIPKEFWSENFQISDSITLEKGIAQAVQTRDGIYEFTLKEANIEKVAKISVLPRINYAESESGFSFKIGIDKRDIKLAPEKTKERIEKLNKTIENIEKISGAMGKTIQGLKGACIGVGGALHIKNLAQNAQGKGIARQKVMRGDGGWYEICTDAVNSGKIGAREVNYKTQDECLIKESDNIDADVKSMTEILARQQEYIQETQKEYKSSSEFLEEKTILTESFAEEYSEKITDDLKTAEKIIEEINLKKSPGSKINLGDVEKALTKEGFTKNLYDISDAREIDLSLKILQNPEASERMKNSARENLYSTLFNVQKTSKSFVQQTSWAGELGIEPSQISTFAVKEAEEIPYTGINNNGKIRGLGNDIPVQPVQTTDGNQYLVVVDDSAGTEILPIAKDNLGLMVYDKSGNRVSQADAGNLGNIYFKKFERSTYENPFKRSAEHNSPAVRYYETEAYKNLPSVVPFDLKNGWYAASRQNLPVLGNIRSYDSSGRVNNFYLCNVGPDGIEEFFSGIGDDTCQQIFLESAKTYRSFSGLTETEALNLVESAVSAIEQASTAKARSPNLKTGDKIRITTRVGGSVNVEVGRPAVEVPDIQCQDFMSPKECNIIFNLCDPVICPSSRCDFGGEYPVKDVVQSGIAGSTLLCLPNAREKIYAPVCLTGIQAGLDGFNSVEKAYRDCLQTSVDTGETVGICDEIQSIYMCEFFWRQAAPIGKIGISKVVAKIFGQGTRGGGEYLNIANAWESASKSVEYFTQSYGTNAYAAFKARSVSKQIFAPVCEGFISGAVPKIETFFSAVTEPDSPVQFHARFDEIPYSDVTVPPISQYKVFYHIYAGKDAGAYYQVYLKPESESFYQDASIFRTVASGFIPRGEIATETKDFTAPAGYKKLCINVNGQEECGFKEVSTSFAIDYVKDKYAEEQLTKTGVTSEKECVSGSASLYNLLTPNLQSAAESAISPEIYKRGITRICATGNPGKGTDESRWLEVGKCLDVGADVKCWLDQSSLDDSIQFAGTRNETITELENIWIKGLNLDENYSKNFEEEFKKIESLDGTEEGLRDRLSKATSLLGNTFFNKQKARIFFLRGQTYAELAKMAYKNWKEKQIKAEEPEEEDEEEIPEEEKKAKTEEFKSVGRAFRISSTDRTFELIFGFEDGKWYSWVYTTSYQYENTGDVGQPTLSGQTGEFDFTGGKWVSLGEAVEKSEEFSLSTEENNTIKSFVKTKSYSDAVEFLVTLSIKNKNLLLDNENAELSGSSKIFRIKNLKSPINKVYFYYKDGDKWYWSYYDSDKSPTQGGKFWNSVPTILSKGGPNDPYYSLGPEYKMPQDIQELVKSLENKKFYDGAFLILAYEPGISEEISEEAEGVSEDYAKAYKKYEKLFDKYSKENLPAGFTQGEFKALLAAISQWETGLGTKNTCGKSGNEGCDDWLMGYTGGSSFPDAFKGPEKQIAFASNAMKRAFDNPERAGDEDYKKCKELPKRDKIECILSVYNSGLTYDKSKESYPSGIRTIKGKDYATGWKYAEEINLLKQNWENYFAEKTVSEKEFSNIEERRIELAKECADCGGLPPFGLCDAELCSAIGRKLSRECEFRQVIPEGEDSYCIESDDYLKDLKVESLTANLVTRVNANNFNWSVQNVATILRNTIKIFPDENGREYSNNKFFIDQLYKRRFLSEEEYNEISGEGIFDTEEDMKYVYELINKKYFSTGVGGRAVPLSD